MTSSWEIALVEILRANGKEMPLREIYDKMRQTNLVTSQYLIHWKPGGQPKYQCWIRRYLTNLAQRGEVQRVGRGIYKIH